ncbi:MAG: tape measure protein [Myxacorys californica WJT36-NPBG1]|nr:tape measure protein [Myxacorys californica WJT36-NPBG1]
MIERLKGFRNQPQVDQILAQVGAEISRDGTPIAGFDKSTEKEAVKRLAKAEKDINKRLAQLQNSTGKNREKLINEILSGTQNAIAEIDNLKGQNLSGETLKSLTGTQGRIENTVRNNPTLNDARNEQNNTIRSAAVNAQNARVRGLARASIEDVEPATATLGTTLKEGFRKLTNFAAKQFEVQPQPTIKGTLGAIAKSPKARDLATDLAVNGAGFAASQLGSQFGILPELTGDIGGALIARQLISRGRPSAKDLTGDLAGFAIGNTTAKVANAGLDALSGVVPGAGLLRALPFKGALAASFAVPKIQKAAEPFQEPQINGLARAQVPTSKGLLERFKSLLPSNEKKLAQVQRNYEAIYREIATLSGVAFDPNNIPKLAIDGKKLKQLGAQAFFEIEQNTILIDEKLGSILQKKASELKRHATQLDALTHEGRHSIQLAGGQLSIEEAAASPKLSNGANLNQKQRSQINASVDIARRQGVSGSQLDAVRKLETDAYSFESNTPDILARVAPPKQGLLQRLFGRGNKPDTATKVDPLRLAQLEAQVAARSVGNGSTIQGLTNADDIAIVGRAQSNAEKFDQKAARIQQKQDKIFANEVDPLQGGGTDAASRLKGVVAKEAGDYAKAANESLKALGVNLPGIANTLSGLFSGGATEGFDKINSGLKFLAANAAIAIKGFIAFQVLSTVVPQIQKFASESISAAIKLDKLKTALSFSSGANAGKDLAFIRDEANRLGAPLGALQDGFVKLSASTKGTAAAGQVTKDLVTGLGQASTTLGLSAEESSGAIMALGQIASKGKVQAEELRGQLGERIPGAFSIAARAIGVTDGELNKLLETGSVTANDFLPKFARQLQVEFAGAAQSSSQSVQASLNRLGSSFQTLQENTGKLALPAVAAGANVLNGAIGLLANNVDKLLLLATALAFRFSGLGKINLSGLATQVGGLASGIDLKQTFAKGGAGRAALAGVGGFAGQAALLAGVVETGRAVGEVFSLSEKGKQFKDFGDQGETNLKRIEDAAKRARGEVDKIPAKTGKSTSKGFDFTLGLAGATGLDQAGLSLKSDDLIKAANSNPISSYITGAAFQDQFASVSSQLTGGRFEFRPGTTVEELQQQRESLQFDLFRDGTRKATQQALGNENENANTLASAKGIDKEIQDLQNRRNLLTTAPGADKGQLRNLDTEIAAKQAERKKLIDPFTEKQSAVTAQINNVKQALAGDNLSPDRRKGLEGDLQGLFAAQNSFDRLQAKIGITTDKTRELSKAFSEMSSKLEEVKRQSDNAFNKGVTQDLTQQLAQFGSDTNASINAPVQSAKRELDKASAEFEGNKQVLDELAKKLQDPEILDKLGSARIGSTGRTANLDSSIADLELAKATANSDAKPIIDNLINYKKAQDQQTALEKDGASARLAVRKAEEQAKLAEIEKANRGRESQIKRDSNTAQIGLLEKQKTGSIYEADASAESANLQVTKGKAELDSTKQQLDGIEAAFAAGTLSAEEYEKQRREIGDRISDQEVQNAQNEVAAVKAAEAAKLAEIERSARKREAAIKQQESAATVGLIRQKIGKSISEEDAGIAGAQIGLNSANAQKSSAQTQLDELESAFARGIVKKEEYERRSQDLSNNLADLSVRQAEQELALREAINRKIIEKFERTSKLVNDSIDAQLSDRAINFKLGGLDSSGFVGIKTQIASATAEQDAAQQRFDQLQKEYDEVTRLNTAQVVNRPIDPREQQQFEFFKDLGFDVEAPKAAQETVKVLSDKEAEDRKRQIVQNARAQRDKLVELSAQIELKKIAQVAEAETRSLNNKKTALESELKLTNAIADARQSTLKIGIDRANENSK